MDEPRTVSIMVRVTPTEAKAIDLAREDRSRSSYLRRLALEDAGVVSEAAR